MPPHEAIDVEAWAERADWVRGLARALVADANEADDVAQEAWLAALKSGALERSTWRNWIAGVVRNLVRSRRRGELHRDEREFAAARREREPDGDDLLERLEVHERLVAAVRELDEPYRSTILRRYFEALSPEEIARRTNTPVRTVHTRIVRGLAQLREQLDRRHGRRDAWMALLVPFAHPSTAGLAGALALDAKLKVALAGVLCAGALFTLYRVAQPTAAPSPVVAGSSRTELSAPAEAREQEQRAQLADERVEHSPSTDPAAPVARAADAPAATAIHRGVVVDVTGATRAGVKVVFRADGGEHAAETPSAITDHAGAFELTSPRAGGRLEVDAPGLVTVLRSRVHANDEAIEHTVVVATEVALSGNVLDAARRPIESAEVDVILRPDLRAMLGRVLDRTVLVEWHVTTDALGAFELPHAPAVAQSLLRANAVGHQPASISLPEVSTSAIELVLAPLDTEQRHVFGRVVDARGAGIDGAWVTVHGSDDEGSLPYDSEASRSVTTNARGEFDLALGKGDAAASEICAVARGRLPVTIARRGDSALAPSAWPDPLVIEMRDEALTISGVVLDAEGKPLPKALVMMLDGRSFGMVERNYGGTRFWLEVDVETLASDGDLAPHMTADAAGRFTVPGLERRAYRLEAFDPNTMRSTVSAPLQAGTSGVELRLPVEEAWPRIAGVIVDRRGEPVEGARVWLVRGGAERSALAAGGGDRSLLGEQRVVGRDGRFEFDSVARSASSLLVNGPGSHAPRPYEIATLAPLDDLRLVVRRRCHVQIDLGTKPWTAPQVAFEDAGGEQLLVTIEHGEVSLAAQWISLNAPLSEVMSVEDSAITAVFKDTLGAEIARVPVELGADEITVIRP